ncbi:MAG: D-amino acid dehydrogenase [Gammaproteobacteria bacterium]|nr:D-amino acid dehydrogenase [Gammaproteobacteria bacterium]
MHVCVIGAGVVGLCSALELSAVADRVTVIETQPGVGLGTSRANGGQLSYAHVAPLAGPGVLGRVPGWLLDPDAPLRFTPRLSADFWRWCSRFILACNRTRSRQTTEALIRLGALSRELMSDFVDRHGDAGFSYRHNGKMVITRATATLAGLEATREFQAGLGCEQSLLDAAACLAAEPALASIAHELAGGLFTPSEAVADCRLFCERLRDLFGAGDNRVDVRTGERVLGLVRNGDRIDAVRIGDDELRADAFVVCAGLASRELLARVGVKLPLLGLKGYSLTAPLRDPQAAPARSITDADHRIVFARLDDSLRVAGMIDLGQESDRIPTRRIQTLRRQAASTFGAAADYDAAEIWTGLRPASPHGRPIVDRAGAENLWLNVGHGILGFTFGLGTARLLATLVSGAAPDIDPTPYRL